MSKAKKVVIPWNKGKKGVYSKESLKKMSESSKGKPGYWKGKKLSKETKRKLSESMKGKESPRKGKKLSEETKKKMSKSSTGKKHTKKTKRKFSEISRGKNNSFYGKKHSIVSKKKMSELSKKENLSAETRRKMSKAQKEICNTPKRKEEARKWRSKIIIPLKDTSIEVKIQNLLKELKIPFFTHQYIKIKHGYQCDILIPSKNLVIECDGDYWHHYPIGNKLDHIRTKELIKKGFNILRLWEREIKPMTIKQFENKLKKIK